MLSTGAVHRGEMSSKDLLLRVFQRTGFEGGLFLSLTRLRGPLVMPPFGPFFQAALSKGASVWSSLGVAAT
eukprot:jgi/Botrbrau1/8751/Bobra.0090s0025.1